MTTVKISAQFHLNQKVLVEVWNNNKRESEWLPGRFVKSVSADDRPYRIHVIMDNGHAYAAAAPECVKSATA